MLCGRVSQSIAFLIEILSDVGAPINNRICKWDYARSDVLIAADCDADRSVVCSRGKSNKTKGITFMAGTSEKERSSDEPDFVCHIGIVRNVILPAGIRKWFISRRYLHIFQTRLSLGWWSKSLTNDLKTGDHSHAAANCARQPAKPKHRHIEIHLAK